MAVVKKLVRLTLQNPSLAWNKARTTWRNAVTAKWDYRLRDGRAAAPVSVCFKLTNACNLRCAMCGQPREGHKPGDAKYAPPSFFKQRVPLQAYKRVIDEIKGARPNLYLWGGEPFMYSELPELVAYGKSRGLTVQVNTNGMYLRKYAREIVDSGLDDLIISIDGSEELHDRVRGRAGTFDLVRRGIRAIQEIKGKEGKRRPIFRIRGTITPYNFESLADLIPIAEQLGAASLNFNWTWFTTRATGEAYQNTMKKLFGVEALSWIPYQSDVILDPQKQRKYEGIMEQLERIFNNRSALPISMSPYIRPAQVESYYENIKETFGHCTCYAVYMKSYILPNGDVTPCPDFPDYICGNILETPFTRIWNGERYRNWRRELKKRQLFPACYRCCDLFLSDIKFV